MIIIVINKLAISNTNESGQLSRFAIRQGLSCVLSGFSLLICSTAH